jgi:hypothetical protein
MLEYLREASCWLVVLSPVLIVTVAWNVADIIRSREERARERQRGFELTRKS